MTRSIRMFLLLLFSIPVVQFCGIKPTPEMQEFPGRYFDHAATYLLPDSVFLSQSRPGQAVIDSFGFFYIVDFFGARIMRTHPPFQSMRQVGATGTGPGEYIMPDHLFIFHGTLYYTDTRNGLIKSLPLPGSSTKRFVEIPVGFKGSFAISDSLIAIQYPRVPFLRIYSNPIDKSEKPRLIQETLSPPSFYKIPNERVNAGNILIDPQGLIYILPVSPLRISVYQYRQSQVKSIRDYNLERLPGVLSWTAKKEKKLLRLPQKRQLNYFTSSFSVPENMFFLPGTTEALFVSLYTQNTETGHYGYLLSLTDSLLASYKINNMYPLAVHNDSLYFYKEAIGEEQASIECYEYSG